MAACIRNRHAEARVIRTFIGDTSIRYNDKEGETMLDYTTKQIDEHLRKVKEYYDKVTDAEQVGLVRVLQKNEGTTDYIRKYDELVNLFESCGRASLYLKNDIHKFKGYFYLAAKASDICFKLYEKGYRTNSALCSNSMFEYRENMISYDTYAILSGCKELALSLVKEDSLLGSVIMGDYEKAKNIFLKT